jgi:PHD/YefM family antitoxin component YafN of YafNO toxin-antitoxin module
MKSYTYSEARENFALVLEKAEPDGAVKIHRRADRLEPVRRL